MQAWKKALVHECHQAGNEANQTLSSRMGSGYESMVYCLFLKGWGFGRESTQDKDRGPKFSDYIFHVHGGCSQLTIDK